MNDIRQLNLDCESDRTQMLKIIANSVSLMRQDSDVSNHSLKKIDNLIKFNSVIFGYFVDDKLLSFLTSTPWKSLPYYTISNFFVLKGSLKYFTLKNSGVIDLLNHVVNDMESKGYYTFYYVRAEDHWPIKNKKRKNLGFSSLWIKYKDYVVTAEEVVESGKQSQFKTHDMLLGNTVSELKRVVIRYTLPHDKRTQGYDFYES
jgi:hypothetical protein